MNTNNLTWFCILALAQVAIKLKRRAFELLGIHPYDETFADGLQVTVPRDTWSINACIYQHKGTRRETLTRP